LTESSNEPIIVSIYNRRFEHRGRHPVATLRKRGEASRTGAWRYRPRLVLLEDRTLLSFSILLNKGQGAFSPSVSYSIGAGPSSLVVADLNSDGLLDIATANSLEYTLSSWTSVLHGSGNGTFHAPIGYSLGYFCASIEIADFNGDQVKDLVVTDAVLDSAFVMAGTTSGHFRTRGTISYRS
jgi:hypothetical protein